VWQLNGAREHKLPRLATESLGSFLAAHMKDTKTATALGLHAPPTFIRVDEVIG
jgi:hypothetical protein